MTADRNEYAGDLDAGELGTGEPEGDELATFKDDAAEFGVPWDGAPPVARATMTTADGDVSFLRWGTEQPKTVLLHGVALNAHTWDTFALAARRPLLAFDLPGHGSSAWRDDARYDAVTIAPAVAEVIDKEAPGTTTVVGQSLGGLTAIALSALRPGLVQRLVLIDVSPGIRGANQVRSFLSGPEVFSSREEIVERARAYGFGHSRESVARGVLHNTRVQEDGSVVWKHHVGNLGGGPTFAFDPSALWPPLESFAGHVLLVRGERGFLSPEDADELRRRVPQAEVVNVAAGHNVQEDEPVLLAEIVNRFLAGTR
jgi:pimeloyl-ACP methyl ester carboxylesterase